jgi:hypothetical protein
MIDIINQNIQNLTTNEQHQLFRMLTDHASILIKLMPDAPLLKYVVSGYTTNNDPVIQAYTAWKLTN